MAPEQAVGDGHVDHRADLYALGVLAYEMLAGQPPFRSATTQGLVAAHLTLEPPPLTAVRPAVPPRLAEMVHICLAKRAADRFQTAAALTAALEGATAHGDARGIGTGTEGGGARPWPVARVLGWFGLASAVIIAAAWTLRTLLGLPDWFFAGAVLLLALGLPIVLIATAVHNHALRHPGRTPLPLPPVVRNRLTLRGALTGGVLSFAALGLFTGAWASMRVLGIGPLAPLIASGKLEARDRLIIAHFENQARDSLLGAAVTEAFRIDFSQSPLVVPVEGEFVRRVLARMERGDIGEIDAALAREIAQREGIKAVVAGEVRQVGPSLLISARLLNAETEEILASARETARDSTEILDAVDRVSTQLRRRIGESLRTLRASPPLPEVTTRSLEGLRRYAQAIRATDAGMQGRAVVLLGEAIAADSSFAMAWRKLGTVLFNEAAGPERAAAALTRAFELRDRLTFRERKLTEASYYMDVAAAPDSAAAALESLLAEYPEDAWALNNLGVLRGFVGDLAEAAELYQRAVALDSGEFLSRSNLFFIQVHQGRFDSAAVTLERMRVRFPSTPEIDAHEMYFALGRRDFAAAEPLIRAMLERHGADPRARAEFTQVLAGTLQIRGKLQEAERAFLTAADLFAGIGLRSRALNARLFTVQPQALYLNDQDGARARLARILEIIPIHELPPRERPLYRAVNAASIAGDRELAEASLAEFDSGSGAEPGRVRLFLGNYMRGLVLAMRNETLDDAIAAYRRAGGGGCYACTTLALAKAFDRAAMPDSALTYFERWDALGEANWSGPGVFLTDQPLAWRRMGELYESRGDLGRAARYYARFSEVWSEADAALQPQVREVQRRLAALVEPSR